MGPRAVAIVGNTIYIANQMNASVTVADLASASVQKTFAVDPGPMALAVNTAKNQLLVLAEGTGTVDVVDLSTSNIIARLNAGDTEHQDQFRMPFVTSISPNSGAIGSTQTITIKGSNLDSAKSIDFVVATSHGMGGMMGGHDEGFGQADSNLKVSNFQVNELGTQITASVQILSSATVGSENSAADCVRASDGDDVKCCAVQCDEVTQIPRSDIPCSDPTHNEVSCRSQACRSAALRGR